LKFAAILLALSLIGLGSLAWAAPVTEMSDYAPVMLDIQPWFYVSFLRGGPGDGDDEGDEDEGEAFYLEVEAGETGAYDVKEMVVGSNTDAVVTGVLTPPPGAPGIWRWEFLENGHHHGHGFHLGSNGKGRGKFKVEVMVVVEGITINDPAGYYAGGEMAVFVASSD